MHLNRAKAILRALDHKVRPIPIGGGRYRFEVTTPRDRKFECDAETLCDYGEQVFENVKAGLRTAAAAN